MPKGNPGQARPNRVKIEKRPCLICKNLFKPRQSSSAGKYCSRICYNISMKGEGGPNWRGGYSKKSDGYILKYVPEDTRYKNSKGYMPYHRYQMEEYLERQLRDNENVHHRNGIRDDNRIENLELWITSQPSGQRIEDMVEFAKEILELYKPELLRA